MIRRFVIVIAILLVSGMVVVKTDMVGRVAYSVEKARLRAMRDAFPDALAQTRYAADKARIEAVRESLAEQAKATEKPDTGRRLAAAVLPAVVSIATERVVTRSPLDDIHRFLFPRRRGLETIPERDDPSETEDAGSAGVDAPSNGVEEPEEEGAEEEGEEDAEEGWEAPSGQGSGFIFDAANGYILTNGHVVAESDRIEVRLADGRRFDAQILGHDEKTDLAVIKIDADRLHEIPLGDSSAGEVGDEVFAVGNPFGLDGSISRGIISAKNRSNVMLRDVEYQGFLQTDAVINPGNSGGPLINAQGQVIGINTAIATTTGYYDGIGFAIPSNRAARILPQLIKGESVTRGYLGVRMGPLAALKEEILAKLDWHEPYGVVVLEVLPDSPALKAGLQAEDILVTYENLRIGSTADLTQSVADSVPGTTANVEVWREKSLVSVRIEIGKQPDRFSTRGWAPSRPSEPEKP